MKAALIMLLLGTMAGASAANLPSCGSPFVDPDPGALPRANSALTSATAAPGEQDLLLAAALADLAAATAGQAGGTARPGAGRASALDLLERAQAIWSRARPTPELAHALQDRGRVLRARNHCALAAAMFESALAVSDKIGTAAGAGVDALAASIMRDAVLVAIAMGDDPTLNTLAPRLVAALGTDSTPLARHNLDVYLDVMAYYYKSEDNTRAEQVASRLLAHARAVPAPDESLLRRLNYELASIYYAQLRYKEAEALVATLAKPFPGGVGHHAAIKDTETRMIALVRGGDLAGALAVGQEALRLYEAKRDSAATALTAVETALEASAGANAPAPTLKSLRDQVATARQERTIYQAALASAQGQVGELQHALGRHELALALYQQSLASHEVSGYGGLRIYEVLRVRSDLALLYRARGETAKALALQQQVRAELLPLVGARHPDLLEAEREIAAMSAALPAAPADNVPAQAGASAKRLR
jgi:tetratricopeptide (TPR) repeat protein